MLIPRHINIHVSIFTRFIFIIGLVALIRSLSRSEQRNECINYQLLLLLLLQTDS